MRSNFAYIKTHVITEVNMSYLVVIISSIKTRRGDNRVIFQYQIHFILLFNVRLFPQRDSTCLLQKKDRFLFVLKNIAHVAINQHSFIKNISLIKRCT